MRQPKRFIVDATDEHPDGDFVYYTEFQELETKYNFIVSSALKNARERDRALADIENMAKALDTISNNSCCAQCEETMLVAIEALKNYREKYGDKK